MVYNWFCKSVRKELYSNRRATGLISLTETIYSCIYPNHSLMSKSTQLLQQNKMNKILLFTQTTPITLASSTNILYPCKYKSHCPIDIL